MHRAWRPARPRPENREPGNDPGQTRRSRKAPAPPDTGIATAIPDCADFPALCQLVHGCAKAIVPGVTNRYKGAKSAASTRQSRRGLRALMQKACHVEADQSCP
ncbi:hypothetical protein BOSE62_30105 [Bosea sp. 62]|nr:hypothetical protein BOSE46_140127 [Bosea sp. 46]CAD5269605.1 hypothetical protein BOSE7B_20110 [Bosea sp. 7B]VVT62477.1 hypothetical protein BOS5A_80137 [Bosea sp. EC-HK365B]VXB94679.1 hypothetical protein BOSE29B_150121 [Bosea sp. 29B]VXC10061.1 hypothetical protein BOSE62_30105 [Bosea sp. 62]VXC39822.1 hypothetical protein BOSE125_200095 [Bosea sp. 125]VXC63639.1 hypothetical protein BOSE127_30124 [Bosea sp. 127]